MEPREEQKRSLLLVVAGACRGVLLPCLQDSVYFLFGKSIQFTIWFVSIHHCVSLWLGYDHVHMYHSVIPYVYVDSSYRSLSGVLIHFFPMKIVHF